MRGSILQSNRICDVKRMTAGSSRCHLSFVTLLRLIMVTYTHAELPTVVAGTPRKPVWVSLNDMHT
jgi:hypothetical protein